MRLAKLDSRIVSRVTSRLVLRGRVSREKVPGTYSRYYLTDEQLAMFQRLVSGGFHLRPSATDAATRLRFLKDLQERTVYRDSATLAAIVQDYEVALREAADI